MKVIADLMKKKMKTANKVRACLAAAAVNITDQDQKKREVAARMISYRNLPIRIPRAEPKLRIVWILTVSLRTPLSKFLLVKIFRSKSSKTSNKSGTRSSARDESFVDYTTKSVVKNTGIGLLLQNDIVNQIYPKTHIKIHQFWRRIDQLNTLQKEFKELLVELINDQLLGIFLFWLTAIESEADKERTRYLGKWYIEYIRFKLEGIRKKCWKYLNKCDQFESGKQY